MRQEESYKKKIIEEDKKEKQAQKRHEDASKARVNKLRNFAVTDDVLANGQISKGDCKRSCDKCPSCSCTWNGQTLQEMSHGECSIKTLTKKIPLVTRKMARGECKDQCVKLGPMYTCAYAGETMQDGYREPLKFNFMPLSRLGSRHVYLQCRSHHRSRKSPRFQLRAGGATSRLRNISKCSFQSYERWIQQTKNQNHSQKQLVEALILLILESIWGPINIKMHFPKA